MSTHGRSGLGRWVYGSVAEAVLARSPVPVLLVRAAGPESSLAAEVALPRLLVPLDGSAGAEAALPYAAALARVLGGTLVLLRALLRPAPASTDPSYFAPPTDDQEAWPEQAEAEAYLARIASRLKREGIRTRVVVRRGPAAEGILEEGRTDGVSLVVMATHGRTGLSRLLFGSVAAAVLRHGSVPVLLVRPPGLHVTSAPLVASVG